MSRGIGTVKAGVPVNAVEGARDLGGRLEIHRPEKFYGAVWLESPRRRRSDVARMYPSRMIAETGQ
jgi:hypothetical protein